MDTFLMLSGGIDSVYCLWRHVEAGKSVRTHHVVLRDFEGRHMVESRATRRALRWIRRNYPGVQITHSESVVDFKDIRYLPRNNHLWSYWTGVILANPRNSEIDKIIRTCHLDSWPGGPEGPEGSETNSRYLHQIELIARRPVSAVYPIAHLLKSEVVRDTPKALLELCWWCRRPRGERPCHKCHTCRQVDPALNA